MADKTQQADHVFWLEAAKQADIMAHGEVVLGGFLCVEIMRGDRDAYPRRRAQLDLFAADTVAVGGGWWLVNNNSTRVEDAPASGRVLAACFLAVMAETGDL